MRRHETMVPARNLLRRHYDSYGGWFIDTHVDFGDEKPSVRSDVPMAAEHSRSNGNQEEDEEGEEEEERGDDWLRLGIGRSANTTAAPHVDPTTSSGAQRGRLTELELFSDRATTSSLSSVPRPPPPPPPPPLPAAFIPPMMPLFPRGYRRDVSWGFWNTNPMMLPTTSTPPPPLQYGFRRFVYPPGSSGTPVLVGSGDVRVVRPPRRPQAGVWFVLQASQNQAREPFLPQIPKNYLRIKDGRMTVRLLMKYLVNKLGLDDESEVEITCRGQPLLPYLTLQHVRDNIWCQRAVVELLPDSPEATTDNVMTLHYGRSST